MCLPIMRRTASAENSQRQSEFWDDKAVLNQKADRLERCLATMDVNDPLRAGPIAERSQIPANQELTWTQPWRSRRKQRPKVPAAKKHSVGVEALWPPLGAMLMGLFCAVCGSAFAKSVF